MARGRTSVELRRAIREARKLIVEAEKADSNEAETRRRIEVLFDTLMDYDRFKHLSRERAVRGAGETEHVDFAIQLDKSPDGKPVILVEIKRVNVNLALKHLKQVTGYAINEGCEWAILTNGREWQLYHIAYGQPPDTKFLRCWNLVTDELAELADHFELISYKSVKSGALNRLWERTAVLDPRNLLRAILSRDLVRSIRRELRKSTGTLLPLEDIVAGVRRLLNANALAELEEMDIAFPERKRRRRRSPGQEAAPQAPEAGEPINPADIGAQDEPVDTPKHG